MKDFKTLLTAKIAVEAKLDQESVAQLLEVPPDEAMGDFALPCFSFAKEEQKAPPAIAEALVRTVTCDDLVEEVRTVGPYVNFFLNKERVVEETVTMIVTTGDSYGKGVARKEKVMVEYSQPNTHKAFHVGHLRGTSMGEALSRILRHAGFTVIQANYSGDTGMHVAKWLWCYKEYHDGEAPPQELGAKGRWLANIYVDAVKRLEANPELQVAVDAVNKALDKGEDAMLMDLWERTRAWSIEELEAIYEELDAHFDEWWFEREFEARAKSVAKELLEKGIAVESDGATIINYEEEGKGVWVLLRQDGTVLYSAKDIALAEKKFNEYDITRSLYVVGRAQALHLEQLFLTLEKMGFPHAKKCFHLDFEEVRLPSGKMSSRTGQNILYTDLRDEVFAHTEKEIRGRHDDWSDEQVASVVKAVGVCALKYEMIARDHNKNITFDTKKVCDFEGDTGPYIQYTNARCNSILSKLGKEPSVKDASFEGVTSVAEYRVVKKLLSFPAIVEDVATTYYPAVLAKYVLDLAKSFNKFYHECKVVGEEKSVEQARALLVLATRTVLSLSLRLLGIQAPRQM